MIEAQRSGVCRSAISHTAMFLIMIYDADAFRHYRFHCSASSREWYFVLAANMAEWRRNILPDDWLLIRQSLHIFLVFHIRLLQDDGSISYARSPDDLTYFLYNDVLIISAYGAIKLYLHTLSAAEKHQAEISALCNAAAFHTAWPEMPFRRCFTKLRD